MKKEQKNKKHKHYWFYPHTIISGKTENETRIVRYCECGKRQMSIIKKWWAAKGDYRLDEHYN